MGSYASRACDLQMRNCIIQILWWSGVQSERPLFLMETSLVAQITRLDRMFYRPSGAGVWLAVTVPKTDCRT